MDAFLIISILIIVVGCYMTFVEFTTERYYSSAIVDLFLFQHGKWRLYRKAKKEKVKIYRYPLDYELDADMGDVPEFYLYPIVQKDGEIHHYLYTDNYKFITDNFQLISKLWLK